MFSHTLTPSQIKEIYEELKCDEIIEMPPSIKEAWQNVTEETDINIFKKFLLENLKKDDYVLIQGEWGFTYNMVNFAKNNGYVPIYSGNYRNSQEYMEGDRVIKKAIFIHTKFKRY